MLPMLKFPAAAVIVSISFQAFAQDATLPECQRWKDKIDYYSEPRKTGGSASQMESWKKARQPYKDKFQGKRCLKYGKKIK